MYQLLQRDVLTIINATVWEFPKRENGGTHDRHKGLFCALAN